MKPLRNRARALHDQQLRLRQHATRRRRVSCPIGFAALALLVPTTLATVGCTAGENVREHNLYVWPLADILHALDQGESLGSGPNQILPEGISPTSIIAVAPDGTRSLRVEPAFAEGVTAAYVTTDVWLNIPLVWLQPAYVEIENWSAQPTAVPDAPILIDVEHRSLFYSPFWNIELAVVGQASSPERFLSTRELLDVRPPVAIHPGGRWNYPITPHDFFPAPPDSELKDPTWGFTLDNIPARYARFNRQETWLLDLGAGTFNADDTGLVEALPFFVFAKGNADGALTSIQAPRVAGVGPLWSGRPATVIRDPVTGRDEPRLGMFWLLVVADLPASADAFRPDGHPMAVAAAAAAGIDLRGLDGRVAMDASCFDDAAFPNACNWLDSQARIEGALGSARIIATKLTLNSTFVSLDKSPVHR